MSVSAFHLRGNRISGMFAVNRGSDVRVAMKLMEKQAPVEDAALADLSVDLRKLGRSAGE
jgi:3-phenylpropionate/trans-cinnamate dioxygenase ferredoxin reductase subunit